MMKRNVPILAGVALALCAGSLHASKFNLEGLKEMQERGKALAEEAKNLRWLTVADEGNQTRSNDPNAKPQCLQVAGSLSDENQRLQVRQCGDQLAQRWRFDEKNRLVSAGGLCLGFIGDANKPGAKLKTEKCGKGPWQEWKNGKDGQLINLAGYCLDGRGDQPATRECDDRQPMQRWGLKELE
jgi:hypothetical protein